MATLTNNINAQNIVDRFADYVVATGNASIVWGTDVKPTMDTSPVSGVTAVVQIIPDTAFGGATGGKSISVTGASITPGNGKITASNIYSTLVAETTRYTSIKNAQAIGRVTGAGGNNGTRLRDYAEVAGRAYIGLVDTTNKAHLADTYQANIGSPANGGVAANQSISVTNLQTFFTTLQSEYTTARDTSTPFLSSVCHSSCHSSCHRNRGRR